MRYDTTYSKTLLDSIEKNISIIGLVESYHLTIGKKNVRIKNCINRQFRLNQCFYHMSGEDNDDFYVNDEKKYYYCFGCGLTGNCYDFLMKVYGISFDSAANILAALLGSRLKKLTKKEKSIHKSLSENYYNYMERYAQCDKKTIEFYNKIEKVIKECLENGFFIDNGIGNGLWLLKRRFGCTEKLINEIYDQVVNISYFEKVLEKREYDSCDLQDFVSIKCDVSYSDYLEDKQQFASRLVLLRKDEEDLPF